MPKHPRTPYVITRNFAVSHLLLKMRCIFFTEQSYTDQRFGCLCNQVLPKTLRFSLQRHKTWEFGLRRIPEIVYRFPSWSVFPPMKPAFFFPNSAPLNSGLWLTAFGKIGLFGCQSAPGPPYVITRNFAVSHLLLKMRCIFFTEQSYTDQRFCRFCNPGLPKTLRFSLQRHKSCKKRSFLRLFAGFFMEESFWGFVGLVLVVVLWFFLFFTGTDCFEKKFKEQKNNLF